MMKGRVEKTILMFSDNIPATRMSKTIGLSKSWPAVPKGLLGCFWNRVNKSTSWPISGNNTKGCVKVPGELFCWVSIWYSAWKRNAD